MNVKKATIRDVAREAGVAQSTVSRYLNGENVVDSCRRQISRAIRKLNYRPSDMARGFKNKKSFTVGVLVPVFADMFSATIAMAVTHRLEQDGYSSILCEYAGEAPLLGRKIEFLNEKWIDGLVILSSTDAAEEFGALEARGVPIVSVDSPISAPSDRVLLNNEEAARTAIRYLVDNGHRRIAILSGSVGGYTSELRLAGYRRALEEAGIEADETLIFRTSSFAKRYDGIVDKLFAKEPPTAVFVTNYYLVLGLIMELNRRSIRIPEDVSIIGFDDLSLSRLIRPSLTLVSQPMQEMGACAAELLLARMNRTCGVLQEKRFDGTLIIGQSVKRL